MKLRCLGFIVLLLILSALPAGLFAAEFRQENSADNLKGLFQVLQGAIARGDNQAAEELTLGLFPDKARLKQALKQDVAPEVVQKIRLMHQEFLDRIPPAQMLDAGPDKTEIHVHGAATEEIADYKKGSLPWKEFPGGARRMAETILRPGVVFYEVELVRPGEDRGMKYHLFYWDGGQWSMLGPVWRAIK